MEMRRRNRLPQQEDDRRDRGDSAHEVYLTAGIHRGEGGLRAGQFKLPRSATRVKASPERVIA